VKKREYVRLKLMKIFENEGQWLNIKEITHDICLTGRQYSINSNLVARILSELSKNEFENLEKKRISVGSATTTLYRLKENKPAKKNNITP
jgi:hypothetical protein